METTDPYIKLSKIRNDYGIEGRQGTDFFLSELDGLSRDQLVQLRMALKDEQDDIQYQINLEEKRLEKTTRWMYGAKGSMRARDVFIQRIDELLGFTTAEAEVAIRFVRLAQKALDEGVFASLLATAQGSGDVFDASDLP